MAGAALNNPGLVLLLTMNCTVCPDSSAGPGEIVLAKLATTCGPASSFTVSFAEMKNDGASFTEFTVMLTSASSESSALALTLNLNESSPLKFAAGVYFTVSVQVLGAVFVQPGALKFESAPWLGFWVMVKVRLVLCE